MSRHIYKSKVETIELPINVTLESIRIESQMISLEADGAFKFFDTAAERLSGLATNVKSFFSAKLSPEAKSALGFVDSSKVMGFFQPHNATTTLDSSIYIPAGMTCNYKELVSALETAYENNIKNLYVDLLVSSDNWLSDLITNPEHMRSVVGNTHIPGYKKNSLEASKKVLGNCFDQKSTVTTVPLKDVTASGLEFVDVVRRLNMLNNELSKVSQADIVAMVEKISSKMELLIKNIKNNNDVYKLNSSVTKSMSKICYDIAEEIEFYSVFMYKMRVTTIALSDSIASLAAANK